MELCSDRCNDRFEQRLDVSNWRHEFQNEHEDGSSTIIASDCLTDDILQLLFDRLTVQEVLLLGTTCRRLYYHLKEAQKRTKALKLLTTRNNYYDDDDDYDDSDYSRLERDFVIPSFGAVASKLITTYSGLRSLSLASSCSPDNIATLFTALPTKLPLLTSLSLAVDEYDLKSDASFPLLEHFWRPLASLESHPSLRQLAITLLCSDYKSWVKQSKQPSPLSPLPILRQLTSFTFGSDAPRLVDYAKVVRALGGGAESHGAHLTPGVDARFEVALFKGYFNTTTPDYDQVSTIEPVLLLLLPYITLLDVVIGWNLSNIYRNHPNYQLAMATLCRSLPQMRHLAKLKLTIFAFTHSTDYPSLLAALSTLTALRTLTVEVKSPSFQLNRAGLAALPSVHHLSLILRRTDHRWDVVERFHLVHVFPELRTLQCFFHHFFSSDCGKHHTGANPEYARCGEALARGVMQLLPERIEKKMEFNFDDLFYFSSLEELMAEGRRKERLEASENKCAELLAENELLRASEGKMKTENELLKRQLQELEAGQAKAAEMKVNGFKRK